MEAFLRKNQENNLLARARIVAAVLQSHVDLLTPVHRQAVSEDIKTQVDAHLYVRAMHSPIQLDGYSDDWQAYEDRMQVYQAVNGSLQYKAYLGTYKRYLYALFEVHDDHVMYRQHNSLSVDRSDHLKIVLRDPQGQLQNYIIATISPGWVNAYRVETENDETRAIGNEYRIKGEWQQTESGYNLEIRIALSLIGNNLAFFIEDVNDADSGVIENIVGTSSDETQPGTIIIPSPQLDAILQGINEPASRTWVVDQDNRVIALTGNITRSTPYETDTADDGMLNGLIRLVYQFLLTQPSDDFKDDRSSASHLKDSAIQRALSGQPATTWRETPDGKARVLTATSPVTTDAGIIGAVAIEETSNSILILENRAMEILINLSVLSFLIAVLTLLLYATRLSFRIHQLRNQAEGAIAQDGRIMNGMSESHSPDEIGDLSRSFSDMLSRLSEYNRYLESMASRLSHELRTPTTIVRSSLDNLEMAESDADRQVYLERAREGMQRLTMILTRMNEATRLEQTLQSEVRHEMDLCRLVEKCVEGYRTAFAEQEFVFENSVTSDCHVRGSEELIAQLLDKLVSNAMDFHAPGTPILIALESGQGEIQLSVINTGPLLPENMQKNLFESMVSVRDNRGHTPHLGLVLYIVRLIAEFHDGDVMAANLVDESGVQMSVRFPLLP